MSKKKKLLYLLPGVIIAIPLLMWIAWLLWPKTRFVGAIIDKTVLTTQGQEHLSLTWILNNERYTKTSSKRYQTAHDYYGFFPLSDGKFQIKGLERFSSQQLKQLSDDADFVYFTDTYGIYNNEWYAKTNVSERSGMLYGGMSNKDMELLQLMKAKKKLIIAEFNTIGSPTAEENRTKFEKQFAMKWTGWTARYFETFDTTRNKELPRWLINNYKKAHQNRWPFSKPGIAFVSNDDRVVILEESTHLSDPMPHIRSTATGQNEYHLPESMKYPFWFDVIIPDTKVNESLADFSISHNAKGKAELDKYGIPHRFPAVLRHQGADYSFYYFSGDFCDNPISMTTSYFKGITAFKWLFYNTQDEMERKSFFWTFYQPLITNIFDKYRKKD